MSYTYFNISDKLRLYEFEGLLDQYGDATAAYSLRKLRNDYTGSAIRVRRSSDDAEQDIGFYDNELDTVAIENFCGEDNHITYSDPSINAEANTLLNSTIALNDWGLGEPSIDNKVILDRDLGNALAYFRQEYVIPGEEYTISCYVKILDGNPPEFGSGPGQQGYLTIGGANFAQPLDYTVTNVATDIYRISATGNAGTGTSQFGFLRWTNAALGQIEVAGMQVTKGGQITDYVATRGGASGFGFVQTWYDQSANANHAVQNTDTAQPKIVDAGTLVTEGGKAAVQGTGNAILYMTSSVIGAGDYTVYTSHTYTIGANGMLYGGLQPTFGIWHYNGGIQQRFDDGTSALLTGAFVEGDRILSYQNRANGLWEIAVNGSSSATGTNSAPFTIDRLLTGFGTGYIFNGKVQEVILYDSDKSSSSDDIEFNINTYYSIY